MARRGRQRPTGFLRTTGRDGAIFGLGLAGAINELFIRSGPERPTVLAFIAGLLGLPLFIRWDERNNRGDDPANRREESQNVPRGDASSDEA